MSLRVSVIIPTYKRRELLKRTLHALSVQTLAKDLFEVIVGDDEPSQETRAIVSEESRRTRMDLHYVPVTDSQGPAAARNRGADRARAPVLAFTDDDCIPDREWLSRGLARLAKENLPILAGQIVVPRPLIPTDYENNEAGLERSEFATANIFIQTMLFRLMGGFNEQFKAAWREDSDLHFRLLAKGVTVKKAGDVIVYHPVRPAFGWVSVTQQRKSHYDALLYKLHPQLYSQKIGRFAPRSYYASVAGIPLIILGGAFSTMLLLLGILCIIGAWIFLTYKRLEKTSKNPSHIMEMAATSLVIPMLSLFWRARGGIAYKVTFL